ncbi:ABC transporter substrate-binding protein [Marinobacterium arenosum]|uniref:ABC transporter substrate-binding protein n=1 Tax=Marinobacterium arenosum TaxID=2862496 RepID=UPI001C95303A|nr:ABC transporter substrate-binding protein [Marinobacterium arenosum]MBY4676398.1 ABC transporter substrate-binding protein [Marinobacterium arenosum]
MVRILLILLLMAAPWRAAWALSVTFINPGKQGERFWDMVTETMTAAAADFDIRLEVLYAERNRVRMKELGIAVTERAEKPDYLLLVNEEQAAEEILAAAEQAGIPSLMLLSDFIGEQRQRIGQPGERYHYLLGSLIPDYFGAGARMMRALVDCVRQQGGAPPYHLLALGGDQLTPASIDRNRGALAVLAENVDFKLDRFLFAHWNFQEAQWLSDRYLAWAMRNDIRPVAVWAANDPIAAGAAASFRRYGRKPGEDLCLVGLNWSPEGVAAVQRGELLLTDGGHFLGGGWAMVLLYDHHQSANGAPIGAVRFPMQAIDRGNIADYLRLFGERQWARIDFRRFSRTLNPAEQGYQFTLDNLMRHAH